MVEEVYKKIGLEGKIFEYANDIKRLKKEYGAFYDYFSGAFHYLYGLKDEVKFYEAVESIDMELQLVKAIDKGCYMTLSHVYFNVVKVKKEEFER